MVVKSLTQLDCWILDVTKKKIEGPWKIQVLTQLVEKTRISPALAPSKKTPKPCCALWILEWGSSHETLISNLRWRWLCDKDLVSEFFALCHGSEFLQKLLASNTIRRGYFWRKNLLIFDLASNVSLMTTPQSLSLNLGIFCWVNPIRPLKFNILNPPKRVGNKSMFCLWSLSVAS